MSTEIYIFCALAYFSSVKMLDIQKGCVCVCVFLNKIILIQDRQPLVSLRFPSPLYCPACEHQKKASQYPRVIRQNVLRYVEGMSL